MSPQSSSKVIGWFRGAEIVNSSGQRWMKMLLVRMLLSAIPLTGMEYTLLLSSLNSREVQKAIGFLERKLTSILTLFLVTPMFLPSG